jgi:hypothetical protein
MFGSDTIEVVIGLVFIFFIMSLLCTTFTEWISRIFAMRAKNLKQGILKLLSDDDFLKNEFLEHPLVKTLSPRDGFGDKLLKRFGRSPKDKPFPSNLPARTFSMVILETIKKAAGNKPTGNKDEGIRSLRDESLQMIESLEKGVEALPEEMKKVMSAFLDSAKTKVVRWEDAMVEFRTSIEKWFDDSMDRVSGWYKRKTQVIVIISAFVFCFALNVDTFVIANSLYQDTTLREAVVAAAEARMEEPPPGEDTEINVEELRGELSDLKVPIGWSEVNGITNKIPGDFGGWVVKILGILFTALAVSLGASFWFDLLNKLVNLRASGKKPDKTEDTKTAVAAG